MTRARSRPFGIPARLAAAAAIVLAAFAGDADAAERMALVIGNGAYAGVAPLKNPPNDADQLAKKLKSLGFEVMELTDLKGEALWTDLDRFTAEAKDAKIVLFYFSGHAFQLNNVNYLVPVDAHLSSVEAIKSQTWVLNDILKRIEALKTNSVVMLDACRNNPLPASMQHGSSSGSGGLARIESGADTMVVFATQPNAVAYEGTGDVSYFTQALIDHIDTEGLSLDDLIRRVRNQVRTETNRRQVPWSGGNLADAFYFKRKAETRDALTSVDLENLLLNFPPEQRQGVLQRLKETMGIDLGNVETQIASIAPNTGLSVLIDGDTIDAAAPPAAGSPAAAVLASAPAPQPRPDRGDLASVPGGSLTVALLDPSDVAAPKPPVADDGQDKSATSVPHRLPRREAAEIVTRNSPSASLTPVRTVRVPVTGAEFWLDDDQSRAALTSSIPALAKELTGADLQGQELARAIQSELDRLGCYRSTVDGIWGRGSRFALTSYYLAKGILFDDLETSPALLRQLQLEPRVVCTGTETRAPRTLARVETPVAKPKVAKPAKAPKGTISTPAQEEIKKGNTYFGIRVR